MKLDRVTITGADDNTDQGWMQEMSARYPFVEWGILLSKNQEGTPRFPTTSWIEKLKERNLPRLSGHLCGRWVRLLLMGENVFLEARPSIARMFHRVQLNFHAMPHSLILESFNGAAVAWGVEEFIVQMDVENDRFLRAIRSDGSVRAVPLFDISGGAGIEPAAWPKALDMYCGYAGGLDPLRLDAQMEKIAQAAGDARIWIDVEARVRTDDREKLDPARCEMFLAKAEKYVTP